MGRLQALRLPYVTKETRHSLSRMRVLILKKKKKNEEIVFNQGGVGSGKRKRKSEVEKVTWLGIKVDDTLDFDHHWKSRLAKARQLLGSLCSMGSPQWGISCSSWR